MRRDQTTERRPDPGDGTRATMSTGGAESQHLDLPATGTPVRSVHLPRRVRRRRAGTTSLSTTVADQVQWSVARPAGKRRGGRGDNLRPRRRAKHAGTPFGVRHRVVVLVVTLGLLAAGTVLMVSVSAALEVVGALLVLGGLVLVTSMVWGRPFRSLHAKTDKGRERTAHLRGVLEREAAGLELIAQVDSTMDPAWVHDQCAERIDATRRVVEQALGPDVAAEFTGAHADQPQAGRSPEQADADAKAFYVRYLLAYLDKYAIAADWRP